MKGKKKDDNGKPKSASESMRTNQLADLLAQVELEWLTDCSGFQLKQVREAACSMGFYCPTKVLYVLSSFRANLVVFFVILCTNSNDDNECEVE